MADRINDLGDLYPEETQALIAWHAGQVAVLRHQDRDEEDERQLKFHLERLRAWQNFLNNFRKALTTNG
jgi:hypothetical protein